MHHHIDNNLLDSFSIEKLIDKVHPDNKKYFALPSGREHYRFLAYISTLFDGEVLVDVGTHTGTSALALSYNLSNKIVSYDLVDKRKNFDSNEQIEFKIKDCCEDLEILLKSPFILLDVDHEGTFERKFMKLLFDNNYKGVVMLDDIYLNEQMKSFWDDITLLKYDVTNIGHYSGTGIVYFK